MCHSLQKHQAVTNYKLDCKHESVFLQKLYPWKLDSLCSSVMKAVKTDFIEHTYIPSCICLSMQINTLVTIFTGAQIRLCRNAILICIL